MNRFGAGPRGGLEQPLLVEVALGRGSRPDQVRLVCGSDMQRATVGLRIDGDGSDSELAQRAEDANRDLAAVGDENFREHGHARLFSRSNDGYVVRSPAVFIVEILGNALGPPAASVGGRLFMLRKQALERELDNFPRLWVVLRPSDEIHPPEPKRRSLAMPTGGRPGFAGRPANSGW